MTDQTSNALQAAIETLQARRPKPRGRKQALVPYVPQLRELIAAGWSRAEIDAEVKALGGKMSPALLRDVLQLPPAKPKQVSRPKSAKPSASDAPPPASPPPPAAAPYYQRPPALVMAPLYNGLPADDADAE